VGRTVLLLASVALAVLSTAGVAWAATIDCGTGEDLRAGRKGDIACGARRDDAVFFDEGIDVINPVNRETLNPRRSRENNKKCRGPGRNSSSGPPLAPIHITVERYRVAWKLAISSNTEDSPKITPSGGCA
jgi:hypothetical protein